jgi:hypothetical protein
MLAGPGTKGDVLLADQTEAFLLASGVSKDAVTAYIPLYKKILHKAITLQDTSAAISKSMNAYKEWKSKTDPKLIEEIKFADESEARTEIAAMIYQASTPWFKYFCETDPTSYIRQLNCKVLALNGAKDIQVLPAQNLAGIQAALKKSKSKLYETKELPGLNHLFQHCKTCTVQEYAQLEETFAPEALDIIVKWLDANVCGK